MQSKITRGLAQNPQAALLREEIFVQEQGFSNEFDEIDPIAFHLVILEQGEPVATGRTYPSPEDADCFILGRIAVRRAMRGQHWGAQVVRQLEDICRQQGAERCHLSAQLQAQGFY